MDTEPTQNKSGQAVIEFCIGIVAMLAVIGGIFQLGRMGQARMDARVEATRAATAFSMLDEDLTGMFLPRYIRAMHAGPDGWTYSQDDVAIGGDSMEAYERIIMRMPPQQIRQYAPNSPVAEMEDGFEMMLGMGLVAGTGAEFGVPVFPIVRRLFFDRPSVNIQVQAWSTRTGGIY